MKEVPKSNSVFWDQAPTLLNAGWKIQLFPTTSPKAFHATFEDTEKTIKVVIDKKANEVTEAKIEATDIFYTVATHGKDRELKAPLKQLDQQIKNTKVAEIRMVQPKPNILWTLAIDGALLTGEKNKPQRFLTLGAAMETAAITGTTDVRLIITRPARSYFKARKNRSDAITQKLASLDLNVRTWCLDNGHDYTTVNRVLNRGDNIPEVKTLLAELAEQSEQVLWPEIHWDDN